MAETTQSLGRASLRGDRWEHRVEVTVESLETDGGEPWDPSVSTQINAPDEVLLIGQTDPSYRITWNFEQERFDVVNAADGSAPAAGTNIGSVRVRVVGVR